MLNTAQVWAFDVDGTLIGSIRSDQLRPGVQDLLVALNGQGARCVLWSAGGADYAHRMASNHGIVHHFCGFYSKQDRGSDGRFGVDHFDALDLPTVFVDDAPQEVPLGARVVGVSQFMGGNPADEALLDLIDAIDDLSNADADADADAGADGSVQP